MKLKENKGFNSPAKKFDFFKWFSGIPSSGKAIITGGAALLVCGLAAGGYFLFRQPEMPVEIPSSAPVSSEASSLPSSEPESSEPESSEPESSEPESSEPESSEVSSVQASSKEAVSSAASTPQKAADPPPAADAVAALPDGYQESFANMYKSNKEVKGRLIVPGTSVDYYVPQTNNNDYYLNHTIYKEYNAWGVPFVSFNVTISPEYQSTNTLIYGHSDDKRGLQLSAIKNYKNLDFYKNHPVITFNTVYGDAQYKVLGFFLENVNTADTFPYHNYIDMDDATMNYFVENVRKRSFIDTPVDVQSGDRFITLSTCYSTTSKNFRYALVARKVRSGESSSVDTSQAAVNSDRKEPTGPIS